MVKGNVIYTCDIILNIYTMEYFSAIKNEGNPTICKNRDGPWAIMLSEVNQTNINTIWSHVYVESKKYRTQNTPSQNKKLNS